MAILSFTCVAVIAQAPATESKDVKALMLRAAALNSLTSDDIPPWHLKASYKLFDNKGGVNDQGTIEESWVGPKKFKRDLRHDGRVQTDFGAEAGDLRTGETANPPYLVYEVERMLTEPMQEKSLIEIEDYDLRMVEASSGKLDCLSMKDAGGNRFGSTWCLSVEKPALRITATPQGLQILRDGIVDFGGHFVPTDIAILQGQKTVATVHVESIERMQSADDASLSPTPDASPVKPQSFTMDLVTEGFPIKKVMPNTSTIGNMRGIVTLTATIGKNGRLRDFHLKSGPPVLEMVAEEAASQWIYRPFLLNNDPVETMTTLNFKF